MGGNSWRRRVWIVLVLVLTALGAFILIPVIRPQYVHVSPEPPLPFDAAVAEVRREIAATPSSVMAEGRPILLDHGHPTEKVFVLLHGLSNSPAQFRRFGELLYARGHTVLIPRLPYHGETDPMTTDWARLSESDMLDSANQAVDLARSLGKKITVVGLSISGTVCSWLFQNRADIDRVVPMAPFFAPCGLPLWIGRPLENILLRVPNLFLWWDFKKKGNVPRPPYTYPRFPTRVIGETMVLGRRVLDEARAAAPRGPAVLVVTTASDVAANNAFTARLVGVWRAHRSQGIATYEFPAAEKVPHDFIDPTQLNQRVDLVYPRLLELLDP